MVNNDGRFPLSHNDATDMAQNYYIVRFFSRKQLARRIIMWCGYIGASAGGEAPAPDVLDVVVILRTQSRGTRG